MLSLPLLIHRVPLTSDSLLPHLATAPTPNPTQPDSHTRPGRPNAYRSRTPAPCPTHLIFRQRPFPTIRAPTHLFPSRTSFLHLNRQAVLAACSCLILHVHYCRRPWRFSPAPSRCLPPHERFCLSLLAKAIDARFNPHRARKTCLRFVYSRYRSIRQAPHRSTDANEQRQHQWRQGCGQCASPIQLCTRSVRIVRRSAMQVYGAEGKQQKPPAKSVRGTPLTTSFLSFKTKARFCPLTPSSSAPTSPQTRSAR